MMYEYQLLPFDDLDFFFRFVWYRFEELLLLLLPPRLLQCLMLPFLDDCAGSSAVPLRIMSFPLTLSPLLFTSNG